jgi:hypothetical protein
MSVGDYKEHWGHVVGAAGYTGEDGAGVSIIWNYPNADYVTTKNQGPEMGHIVAPNADVAIVSGDFNGSVICNAAYSQSEGHVWGYHGGKLTTTSEGFTAQKTVNNALPTNGQKYKFMLEELKWDSEANNFTWQKIEEKENNGQRIAFNEIHYNVPDINGHYINKKTETHNGINRVTGITCLYRITEEPETVTDGLSPDPTQYYIKVDVKVTYNDTNDDVSVTDTTVYHKQANPDEADNYTPTAGKTAEQIVELTNDGFSIREIASTLDVSKSSVHRFLREKSVD